MIQGRLDILRAELNRRDGTGSPDLVEGLAAILADEPRAPARGLGRHTTIEPSRADSHRRYVEALVADVDLSDVSARSTDELAHAMRTLSEEERSCPPSAARCSRSWTRAAPRSPGATATARPTSTRCSASSPSPHA